MFLVFIFLFFITSCKEFEQIDEYSIKIVLPELPDSFSYSDNYKNYFTHNAGNNHDITFEVDYPGKNAIANSRKYLPGSSFIVSSGLSILPVVAYPYIGNVNIQPYSAGGIFPANMDNGKVVLTWENGFAAEVLYKAIKNGIALDNFNVSRFEKVLIEKSGGNPWIFEEDDIIYALSFNIFNSNFIKKKRTYSLNLTSPYFNINNEKYMCLNFLDKRYFNIKEQSLFLDNIPERNLSFVMLKTDNTVDFSNLNFIEIFMDNTGWYAYFTNSPEIISGSW
jgi:hypothetical protein